MREGSTLVTDMRTLDDIWQEQQILLPELTKNTEAPSRTTSRLVIKISNLQRPAVFNADPQAVARAIQASFCCCGYIKRPNFVNQEMCTLSWAHQSLTCNTKRARDA